MLNVQHPLPAGLVCNPESFTPFGGTMERDRGNCAHRLNLNKYFKQRAAAMACWSNVVSIHTAILAPWQQHAVLVVEDLQPAAGSAVLVLQVVLMLNAT